MNSQTSTTRAELELAEVTLRDILRDEAMASARSDTTSLSRILVHVVNMHQAISISPERHANVAKRLDDFALSASKMASRNPEAAPKLSKLSNAFRAAGERLRQA